MSVHTPAHTRIHTHMHMHKQIFQHLKHSLSADFQFALCIIIFIFSRHFNTIFYLLVFQSNWTCHIQFILFMCSSLHIKLLDFIQILLHLFILVCTVLMMQEYFWTSFIFCHCFATVTCSIYDIPSQFSK
jgi:hypothetical protein